MELIQIDSLHDKELIATTIMSYYANRHGIRYDSSLNQLIISGLGSQVEHMMVRHAVLALGASGCDFNDTGKMMIDDGYGAERVVNALQERGLRIAGVTKEQGMSY